MKLNIYDGKDIVKTYTAETYDLMFGVIEDVADAINLDSLKNGDDTEIIKMAGEMILGSIGTIRELLKDVFEGITDEELKHVKVSEIIIVMVDIVRFTLRQLSLGARDLKN